MIGKKLQMTGIAMVATAACTLWGEPATAHHSYSTNYDSSNPQTITGVIQTVRYASPHVQMTLQTDGTPQQWTIDLPSPPRAQQRGLTEDFLRVGSTATVVGYPARDGSSELGATRVTIGETAVQVR